MSRMRCQLVEMNAVGAGKSVLSTAECVGLCRHPGLNQGPLDLQSNALPTELCRPTKVNCRPLDPSAVVPFNAARRDSTIHVCACTDPHEGNG